MRKLIDNSLTAYCKRRDFLDCKHQEDYPKWTINCGCLLKDYLSLSEIQCFRLKFLVRNERKDKKHCKCRKFVLFLLYFFVLSIDTKRQWQKTQVVALFHLIIFFKNRLRILSVSGGVVILLAICYMINVCLFVGIGFVLSLLCLQIMYLINEVNQYYMIGVIYDTTIRQIISKNISSVSDNGNMIEKVQLVRNIILNAHVPLKIEDLTEVERENVLRISESVIDADKVQKVYVFINDRDLNDYHILILK